MEPNRIVILLVEDDLADARLITELLQELGSFELIHVRTLEEAILQVTSRQVQVALLDLGLPDSSGRETVERLHRAALGLPIVVLTGADEEDDLGLACIAAGAHDYLSKNALVPHVLRRTLSFALERLRYSEIAELEAVLEQYRAATASPTATRPSEPPPPAGGSRRRRPAEVPGLELRYRALLDAFMDQLVLKKPRPIEQMEAITGELVRGGFGAQDLIGLHLRALEQAVRAAGATGARTYAVAGRLMVLEMMGRLADRYRALSVPNRSEERSTEVTS